MRDREVAAHRVRQGVGDAHDERARLEGVILTAERRPVVEWMGKPASAILETIGVEPPPGVRLLVCEATADHPFVVHELMMPVLGLVRYPDVVRAIDLSGELGHGNRHTAIMHSQDVSNLRRMGRLIQTTVFVKNGPSFAGIGICGEGFCTCTIAGPRWRRCAGSVWPEAQTFLVGSDVDSAATKASWGTSTRPTIFIRFLPSFCFSSSLRLRVMSPP
ncbi:Succinate-semialdehyde dehydrogenase (acetylating) [Tessaracoccus lapidicaptus]|nr:Succinate-semialdehyde dehydrogenase (acetylating) [Tessaracoccus lapidicaptus]